LTARNELKSQLLGGIATVTSLVLQCDTYQELYILPDPAIRPPKDALDALETFIVQAYANSLLFLGFAIQRQRSRTRAIDAPFKLDGVEKYVKILVESGDQLAQAAENCEKHRVKELHELVEEFRQVVQAQAVQLRELREIGDRQLYARVFFTSAQ
jgi:hypothetical protein